MHFFATTIASLVAMAVFTFAVRRHYIVLRQLHTTR
jgi:hypothetical protein